MDGQPMSCYTDYTRPLGAGPLRAPEPGGGGGLTPSPSPRQDVGSTGPGLALPRASWASSCNAWGMEGWGVGRGPRPWPVGAAWSAEGA